MRSPALYLLAALTLSACQSAARPLTDQQRAALGSEVDSSVTALVDAMNAHDSTAVLAHYAQDERLTYVGVTDVQFGYEAFRRATQQWYATHPDVTVRYQIVQTQVLSPTVAVVVLRGSSTLQPALALTEVLIRADDGQWRIVHEHESWPESTVTSQPHPLTTGGSTP